MAKLKQKLMNKINPINARKRLIKEKCLVADRRMIVTLQRHCC